MRCACEINEIIKEKNNETDSKEIFLNWHLDLNEIVQLVFLLLKKLDYYLFFILSVKGGSQLGRMLFIKRKQKSVINLRKMRCHNIVFFLAIYAC